MWYDGGEDGWCGETSRRETADSGIPGDDTAAHRTAVSDLSGAVVA